MSVFYCEKPPGFEVEVEVSTVFMECKKKLLLLHRSRCGLSPDTWGIPGGKLEKGETPIEGLMRELWEELQLRPNPKDLAYLRSFYVHHPKAKYQLHLFRWELSSPPPITLDTREHQDYRWQPIADFSELPLLEGQLEAFQFVYGNL